MKEQRASVFVIAARGLTALGSGVLQIFQISDFHPCIPIFTNQGKPAFTHICQLSPHKHPFLPIYANNPPIITIK